MAKTDKNSEIPKFLLDKRYLMGSVIFILTFSFLFMTLYTPFSITAWFSITNLTHLGMTAAFYFVALAIMLISKQIMYSVQNRVTFTFAKYILWLFGEMIVISLFYTFFTSVFISPSVQPAWIILLKAIGCVLLIMAIPYTILTLYAAYKAKTEELQMLQYEMSLSNEPTVVYPSLINLYDYNGTLKLTINSDTLYYMESQDNYVKIFYENHGKLLSYMLRCHRSYMVNVMKINQIKKRSKIRYIILSNKDIKPIPVSKSYFKNLIEKIDKYNSAALAKGNEVAEDEAEQPIANQGQE